MLCQYQTDQSVPQLDSRKRSYSTVSNEERADIIHAIDELGMTGAVAATLYRVGQTTVANIKRVFCQEGKNLSKKTNRGIMEQLLSEEQKTMICTWLDSNCLLTLLSSRTMRHRNIQRNSK